MNATDTAKAIKATKTMEELEAFVKEHDIANDERKTVQTAYQDHKASLTAPPAEENTGPKKIKTNRLIVPGGFLNIEGQRYKALSNTIVRNTITGEKFEVEP
jgi:hypothetical protein